MIGWIKQGFKDKHDPVPVSASLFSQAESFGVGGISFDLLISESHGLEFDIPERAMEDGSVITDHVHQKLRECTIVGMFTLHPIGNYSDATVDINYRMPLTGNDARDKVNALEALAMKKVPVRLVTSMRVYPEMLIRSISHNRSAADGEASKFTMVLKEYKRVRLKQVLIDAVVAPPDMNDPQNRKAAVKTSAGLVSAEEATKKALNIEIMGK
jgi:hypothetical protein